MHENAGKYCVKYIKHYLYSFSSLTYGDMSRSTKDEVHQYRIEGGVKTKQVGQKPREHMPYLSITTHTNKLIMYSLDFPFTSAVII